MNGAGFDAEPSSGQLDTGGAHLERELAYWWGLLSSSLLFTIPVFFVAMVLPMFPGRWRGERGSRPGGGGWGSQRQGRAGDGKWEGSASYAGVGQGAGSFVGHATCCWHSAAGRAEQQEAAAWALGLFLAKNCGVLQHPLCMCVRGYPWMYPRQHMQRPACRATSLAG